MSSDGTWRKRAGVLQTIIMYFPIPADTVNNNKQVENNDQFAESFQRLLKVLQ